MATSLRLCSRSLSYAAFANGDYIRRGGRPANQVCSALSSVPDAFCTLYPDS